MATTTIGTVVVASRAARSEGSGPIGSSTSIPERTSSAIKAGNRSAVPCALRNSISRLRPST